MYKDTICLECKHSTGSYVQSGAIPGTFVKEPYPLYQYSYPGQPEYISPRCLECYEIAEKDEEMVKVVTDINQLRKPTHLANENDNVVQIASTMFKAMKELRCQGLAANQIGVNLSIFVMNRQKYSPVCLVNSIVSNEKGSQKTNETCLSLPGVRLEVNRPMRIKVVGFNQYFNSVTYHFEGIEARRACHEVDHLNGKLIIDYKEEDIGEASM